MDFENTVKSAIFIEYYSHEECDCYKINLPWTVYKSDKLVLCPVSEGYEKAKELARKHLLEHMELAFKTEPKNKE